MAADEVMGDPNDIGQGEESPYTWAISLLPQVRHLARLDSSTILQTLDALLVYSTRLLPKVKSSQDEPASPN